MKEINLLKIKPELSEQERRLIKGAKIASFLLLIFYCLAVAGLFSFGLVIQKKEEETARQIKREEQRIKRLQGVESRRLFLKQRLRTIASLLTTRKIDPGAVLTHLETLIPPGVALKKIELNEAGELECSGRAENVVALADFLERLLKEEDQFSQKIKLSSASRQKDGGYIFSLSFNVKI